MTKRCWKSATNEASQPSSGALESEEQSRGCEEGERGTSYAEQNAGVLAGEFVGRLAEIDGRVALLFVEIEELLGETEAHAQPLNR